MGENKTHKSYGTNGTSETNKYNHRGIEPKWPHSAKASRGKEGYDHRLVEPKWEKEWEEAGIYKAVDFGNKPKKYILFEFPYPSGDKLHIGHAFAFTGTDVLARFFRAKGFNVLCPMGWDAFGLPAENYAIKKGINPAITTKENINYSKSQAKRWGLSVDWDREISTTDPNYYRWTQWIFLQWYKKGLAYKKEMPINWCPSCKIGLANEEVVSGKCERCGAEVTRRTIKQWVVKITDYADRLIGGLRNTDFIDKVKTAQINWIGKTSGVNVKYPVAGSDISISCYSTRPDTNFGATFVVIAPEHPLLEKLTTEENKEAVENYVRQAAKKSELERTELEKEKTGVFTGSYCLNRLNNKKMPIYVSDFVVLTAGTGIVVGVPAHDQRDWEFAHKYSIEIVPVVKPKEKEWDYSRSPFTDIDEALIFNSDFLNGLPALEAKEKIIDYLVEKGWGERANNYHLRDWIFSRQHYWGEPIPMIFCEKCGMVPVPEDQLPVVLPEVEKYQPTETGESPLAEISDWVNTACPECGGSAKRETDTMPNWAGSDWYFLAYPIADKLKKFEALSTKSETNSKFKILNSKFQDIFSESKNILSYWLPVDVYVGGDEHNTLHLLYSRFTYQFLWDIGVVPKEIPEPYFKRLSHGVILGPDGQRMSKSRGNVINPDDIVEAFGADALRMYLMFMGPFDYTMAWSQESMEGCYRFLKRVWRLFAEGEGEKWVVSRVVGVSSEGTNDKLERKLNQTIKKVGEDIGNMKFNTAIAAMMELLNEVDKTNETHKTYKANKVFLEKFSLLLAPFAPHITEELWQRLGNKFSIHQQSWPEYSPDLIEEEVATIAVQVNGKLRGTIEVQSSKVKVQSEVEEVVKRDERVQKYLEDKEIKKTIYVPGKLINFVV